VEAAAFSIPSLKRSGSDGFLAKWRRLKRSESGAIFHSELGFSSKWKNGATFTPSIGIKLMMFLFYMTF
jgi:hypothetical protein